MSSALDLSTSLTDFLSKAVEANIAPGLIAVAFNREGIFVSSPHYRVFTEIKALSPVGRQKLQLE